ncbi:MAG: DUF308 domain-containing protein [Synechococcus sp.]|nr:DUF308 domain-containing protein [Synechococcus sp.]
MNTNLPGLPGDGEDSLRSLTLVEGILLLVLAVLALASPLVASVWVTGLVAVTFVIAGLVGWVSTLVRSRRLQRLMTFWRLLLSSLFVLAGGWILSQLAAGPLTAGRQVASLALALGVVFLIEGGVAALMALTNRQVRGWGWGLANGIVTLILGLLILNLRPQPLLGVLGVLVGISFLFSGIDLLRFGASFHNR